MSERIRVLLVDDNRDILWSIKDSLQDLAGEDFDFSTARNSAEAMEILAAAHESRQDFTFVFSDLEMDWDGEGLDFCQKLRGLDWASGISFFLVTGARLDEEWRGWGILTPDKVIKKGLGVPEKILQKIRDK